MTWFKVDDALHSHPKVMAAPLAALGLWVVAGSWSAANLTDGFVAVQVLPRLHPDAVTLADELVTAGLWKRAKGGYQFHDWANYQPSRDDVLEERRKWAEKKAKQRSAKKSPGDTQGDSPGESQGSRSRSRPEGSKEPSKPRKRATQIPDPFELTDAMKQWVRDNTPNIDGWRQHQMFIDHHRSKETVFKDWTAAWRNWMRKAQGFAEDNAVRRGDPSTRIISATEERCGKHPRQPAAACGPCASERNGRPNE